ncbi:MAG: ASKHA domain-containing protein [Clostridiales bacterium]|nr:ASKHA domain-containing protein [Clostridiales bacterium]
MTSFNNLKITVRSGERALDALKRSGVSVAGACGGAGVCGKCGVIFINNAPPATQEDKKFFTPEELEAGKRLACKAVADEDAEIGWNGDAGDIRVLDVFDTEMLKDIKIEEVRAVPVSVEKNDLDILRAVCGKAGAGSAAFGALVSLGAALAASRQATVYTRDNKIISVNQPPLGLSLDIGTTTLSFLLADLATGKTAACYSTVNSQREYGADVLTRIKAASPEEQPPADNAPTDSPPLGKLKEMRAAVHRDIERGVKEVLNAAGAAPEAVACFYTAGNTAMVQLLLGLPCETMGRSPFAAMFMSSGEFHSRELFPNLPLACPLYIFPAFSSYVGGDIVAGSYFCMSGTRKELLVDVGTNAEILLASGGVYYSASAAAGPAFEGGGIARGVAAVTGAIARVAARDGGLVFETIGGCPPVGICGSGVIDILAALKELEWMDETGRLTGEYFDTGVPVAEDAAGGQIRFYQKDIREGQLAKSAVRAGIEILLEEAGLKYGDIEAVYLAGGFGFYLGLESAFAIGMLPEEWRGVVRAVGNSALGGLYRAMLQGGDEPQRRAAVSSRNVNLAAHPNFQDLFAEYMFF